MAAAGASTNPKPADSNPIPRNGPAPPLLIPIDVDLGMWDDGPPERDTGSPPGPPPPDPDDDPPPF